MGWCELAASRRWAGGGMIERTFDYRRIKRLAPWQPIISNEVIYLMERQGGKDLGLWSFNPCVDGWMIHADMGPKCRGKNAVTSAKEAFLWIFNNTDSKKIYAVIKEKIKPACQIAVKAGMKYLKTDNGRRIYEVCYEL